MGDPNTLLVSDESLFAKSFTNASKLCSKFSLCSHADLDKDSSSTEFPNQ